MKKIKLGGKGGGYALIDNEDFEYMKQFKWHYERYAVTNNDGKFPLIKKQHNLYA